MNKALALFLVLAGLAAFVNAVDIPVQVGDPTQGNVFVPAKINAAPGDNLVFTWNGMHSIFEADSLTACAKSARTNTFITSGQAYAAPKTMNFTVPANPGVAKTWIFCAVPGHCTPNTGGMAATIIFTGGEGGATPSGGASPSGGAMPSGAMPSGSGAAAEPTGKSAASRNSIFSAGAVLSSMCIAAAYML